MTKAKLNSLVVNWEFPMLTAYQKDLSPMGLKYVLRPNRGQVWSL